MSGKKEHPALYERSETVGRLPKYAIHRFTDKKDGQSVSCCSSGSKLKPRQQYELNNTQSVLMRSRYYHPTRKAVSNPNDINTGASIA